MQDRTGGFPSRSICQNTQLKHLTKASNPTSRILVQESKKTKKESRLQSQREHSTSEADENPQGLNDLHLLNRLLREILPGGQQIDREGFISSAIPHIIVQQDPLTGSNEEPGALV